MKSLSDAALLRNRMVALLEEASLEKDEARRRELLTFVTAGGGFAGVETTGAVNDFVRETKAVISFALLALFATGAGWFGSRLPSGFLPEEDQGYMYIALQLPDAASLERSDAAAHKIEELVSQTPGVQHMTSIIGFNLVTLVQDSYSAFFFVTLKPWSERTKPEEQYDAIKIRLTKELAGLTEGIAFTLSPPAIPGAGTAGGFSFALEDRSGKDIGFLAQNVGSLSKLRANDRRSAALLPPFCPPFRKSSALAFIFGLLPLWFASGSGAVARRILGSTVIGGMIAASAIAIFLIPVTFYVVERLATRRKPVAPDMPTRVAAQPVAVS